MFELTFQFENGAAPRGVTASSEETILQAAQRIGIAIDAPCAGNGVCGKCRIRLLSGQVESERSKHLTDAEYAEGWRLACCARPQSDLEILIPDAASAFQSGIKTASLSQEEQQRFCHIGLDHGYRAIDVELPAPSHDSTLPDNERLTLALQEKSGCKTHLTYYALRRLSALLREQEFRVRVLGRLMEDRFEVLDLVPYGFGATICGIAVDVGTTTLCAALFDLMSGRLLAKATSGNGQIRYGADVINRIIEQGRPNGIESLQQAVLTQTLIPMIQTLCDEAGISAKRIYRMSIAANTTMNHLLLGLYADPIRTEPYIPSFFFCDTLSAQELSLPLHPNAQILLAPNIGSYVGGDITAGCYASRMCRADELSLFIDLGTNGEIVLGNREFAIACACSAGPAFEGGDISCGMRATDGAIDRCRINERTMEPEFSVIGGGLPAGLCGSGIIDVIAELFRCGIIDAKGQFIRDGERIAYDRYGAGRYLVATQSATNREISICSADIDNFIRAKAAVYSAIDTLLSAMDLDESCLSTVYVAGGIGSGIDIQNAISIGMLPNLPLESFRYIGNSALVGACEMLLSDEARAEIDELSRGMTYMELSTQPSYMDRFVAACFLPHTDAARFDS